MLIAHDTYQYLNDQVFKVAPNPQIHYHSLDFENEDVLFK